MSKEIKVMNNDEIRDFCIKKDLKIFELEQENERLNENNQAMQEEMARTWKKLDEKENIIKEAREYIERKRLTTTEATNGNIKYILEILDKGE